MPLKGKKIGIVATLDTKSVEVSYLKESIESFGEQTLIINTGVYPPKDIEFDIGLLEIGEKINLTPADFPKLGKVGAMEKIAEGLEEIAHDLQEANELSAVVCLGGGVGMWIAAKMMQQIAFGIPKMIISPIPFRDIKPLIGTKDIVLFHSVADITGLNPVLRDILDSGAAGIVGMIKRRRPASKGKKVIGLSVKGITQKAGDNFRGLLEESGFEVMSFHASGMGGKALEEFIDQGIFSGVIELTTQEITGELFGGTTQIEYERFYTAGKKGIPQLICPGGIETISLGPISTLTKEQRLRPHYSHSPSFTHVRATDEEMDIVVKELVERLNLSKGPVTITIPTKGFSVENIEGGKIFDQISNERLISRIKHYSRPGIIIKEFDVHLNDVSFAEESISVFLDMLKAD
jgi:uncharacterized protein (UPF0261 family)